jgi:histidine triad (HIT) family protein
MNKVTSSCIFCQLLKSNQDTYLLEQSQYGVAILDINPISDGHTLVISKTCFSSFIKASEKVISDLVIFSQKMINKLQLILKPKG